MITPVSFEMAKLLKEKGFNKPTIQWYHRDSKKLNTNNLMFSMNKLTDNYSAPTIAEVGMWLYEKYGIWIGAQPNEPYTDNDWCFTIFKDLKNNVSLEGYNSPTEAYEVAIEYALNNLI